MNIYLVLAVSFLGGTILAESGGMHVTSLILIILKIAVLINF